MHRRDLLRPLSHAAITMFLSMVFIPMHSASAQPGMESLTFDAAVARAVEKNQTIAIASTNILRSEAILQQVRSATLPRLGGTITSTTLDMGVEAHHQGQGA